MSNLIEMFQTMIQNGASDLHLTVGTAPQFRINGRLMPVAGHQTLSASHTEALCLSIISDNEKKLFESQKERLLS